MSDLTPQQKLQLKKIDLSKIENTSTTSVEIERWINYRIAELRASNDKPLEPEQTATIRGGIKELKNLLSLLNPKQYKTSKPKPESKEL